MDSCIVCDQIVRPRQEALLCDGCERWQHRTCQTGISQLDYRGAVRSGNSINWRCVEFEAQSPYQSDLPAIPDADLEPQSPANQSDLPVEPALDESSLAESPTATVRQNLSSSFAISFQVIIIVYRD